MLRFGVKKHKLLIFILLGVTLAFSVSFGVFYCLHSQAQATRQAESDTRLAALDKKIDELHKKRAAEEKARKEKEEAERKAAEQKAEADRALVAQQQGKIVTPKGCAISGAHGNPAAIDVIVNKKRCFNPIDFVPPDLASYGVLS